MAPQVLFSKGYFQRTFSPSRFSVKTKSTFENLPNISKDSRGFSSFLRREFSSKSSSIPASSCPREKERIDSFCSKRIPPFLPKVFGVHACRECGLRDCSARWGQLVTLFVEEVVGECLACTHFCCVCVLVVSVVDKRGTCKHIAFGHRVASSNWYIFPTWFLYRREYIVGHTQAHVYTDIETHTRSFHRKPSHRTTSESKWNPVKWRMYTSTHQLSGPHGWCVR